MTLAHCLVLAAALFSLGVYGLLTRRQALGVLLAVELMANAANLVFVSFGYFLGNALGQTFALFAIALTVAEVAVGLALVIVFYRAHGDTKLELAREMRQ